jgi:hypothetical protein
MLKSGTINKDGTVNEDKEPQEIILRQGSDDSTYIIITIPMANRPTSPSCKYLNSENKWSEDGC